MRECKHRVFRAVFATLLCLLATACNDELENEEKRAISFGTQLGTRAAITTNGELEVACKSDGGERIGIYGLVSDALNPTPVEIISNEPLYFDGADWTYDNTRYWVRDANHEFVAIYPYSTSNYIWDATSGTITHNTITLGADNNTDYMWAVATRNLATSPDGTNPVTLDLQHACSLLEFWFVNSSTDVVSDVEAISLEGVRYKGDWAFTKAGSSTLTVLDDTSVYAGGLTVPAGGIPGYIGGGTDDVKDYNLFESMGSIVVMPQQVEGGSIVLKLTVNNQPSSVNLSQLSLHKKWEAGTKYVYIIYWASSSITIGARAIDWVSDEIEL